MYYEIFEKLCNFKSEKPGTVSKATGISTATLTSWKQGKYTPKQDKLQLIANHFGVTIDFLMGKADMVVCPECEISYNPLDEESVNTHAEVHERYEKILEKYGFCYSLEESRDLEEEAINALSESGQGYLSTNELVTYYIQYLKADFSYLLRKKHFHNIPFESFEEYARTKIQDDMHKGFMSHDVLMSLANEFEIDLEYIDGSDQLLARASKNAQLMRLLAYAEKLTPQMLDTIEIQLKALAEQNDKE